MITERFPELKGQIILRYRDKNGILQREETINNLIVNGARTIVRDQLYNPDPNNAITCLQLGDMLMNYGDDTSSLSPPTSNDTGLVNSIITVNASASNATFINSRNALAFDFNIAASQANDSNAANYYKLITELGLFTTNGKMFSRIVTPIVKTRDTALNITWNILI